MSSNIKDVKDKSFSEKIYDFFTIDTTYIYFIFTIIIFLYFLINNHKFISKDISKVFRFFQGFLLIIFYIIFPYLLISYGINFCKESISIIKQKESNGLGSVELKTFKDFSDFPTWGLLILILTYIVIISFGFYVIPIFLTNAGFFPKGLVRIFNPFNSSGDYDSDGLFWGGEGFSGIIFTLLSLPIIAANFLVSNPIATILTSLSTKNILFSPLGLFAFFNPYFIPALFKDELSGIFKYLNPVDWDVVNKMKNKGVVKYNNDFWIYTYLTVLFLHFFMNWALSPNSINDLFKTLKLAKPSKTFQGIFAFIPIGLILLSIFIIIYQIVT